jgi:hypothetical protein
MLLRIRENIREHGGKYVYRREDTEENIKKEKLRDKKGPDYFYSSKYFDNPRRIFIKRKILKPKLSETSEMKLRKAKKELLLQKIRKKSKQTDAVVIRNKRGNPQTEPLYGKAQRRRFAT